MVEITISSGKIFQLHIDVLSDKCDYFHAALAGSFEEAGTKRLKLMDVSDNTFALFLMWVYRGSITSRLEGGRERCVHHSATALSWTSLLNLWFFADYVCAPALQNHIIDVLNIKVTKFENLSSLDVVDEIIRAINMLWKSTSRTDLGLLPNAKPICSLLVEFVANPVFMTEKVAIELVESLPAAFVREYAKRSVKRSGEMYGKIECLNDAIMLHSSDCLYDCGCHEVLAFTKDFDEVLEKFRVAEDGVRNLTLLWGIKSAQYYVKDTHKDD